MADKKDLVRTSTCTVTLHNSAVIGEGAGFLKYLKGNALLYGYWNERAYAKKYYSHELFLGDKVPFIRILTLCDGCIMNHV